VFISGRRKVQNQKKVLRLRCFVLLKEWKDISGSKVECSSFLFEIFNMIKIYLILNGFDKKIYGREL
jgi:hypothetical protein